MTGSLVARTTAPRWMAGSVSKRFLLSSVLAKKQWLRKLGQSISRLLDPSSHILDMAKDRWPACQATASREHEVLLPCAYRGYLMTDDYAGINPVATQQALSGCTAGCMRDASSSNLAMLTGLRLLVVLIRCGYIRTKSHCLASC